MCVTCALFNPFSGDWLHAPIGSRTLSEGSDVAGSVSTTVELVRGDTFNGSLSFDGDWDWFYVEYQAGVTYTITMTPGTLLDPKIFLADANGNLIQAIDNGYSFAPETFVFTASVNGSGYVIADSYYNQTPGAPTDTGTYALTITSNSDEQPDANDPLDAITWDYTAPSVINVYFVPGGETVDDGWYQDTSSTWSAYEIQQAQLAFDTFEAVANVTFNFVTNPAQADFFMVEASGDDPLGYWGVGGGTVTLGATSHDLDGWGVFFNGGSGWDTTGLAQGGFGFITLIHEIGHGLGLAHPHDDGGGSTVMAGVSTSFGDLGDFDLNQGIYTTMSYNDGWQTAPHGITASSNFGFQGTPMAFDIAVLQAAYGANTNTNTGNNSYTLANLNGAGTFYSAIWDAGGTDTIQHSGSLAAVIDLRSAPLTYEVNGGGFVSYVQGIHGGFTIAANVVIENAAGGSGNDVITGNSVANILNGGAGADTLIGGLGNDIYITDGRDSIAEAQNAGTDRVQSSATHTLGAHLENLTLTGSGAINGTGNTLNNVITGNGGNNILNGGAGADTLIGGLGNDMLRGGAGKDGLTGGSGSDSFIFQSVSESTTGATTADVITDFVRGTDKFNLSAIDAFAGTSANDTFIWKGTAAFNSTTKGEVRYEQFNNSGTANDYTMVWIDNDRDAGVEMAIRLTGLHNLSQADFIL